MFTRFFITSLVIYTWHVFARFIGHSIAWYATHKYVKCLWEVFVFLRHVPVLDASMSFEVWCSWNLCAFLWNLCPFFVRSYTLAVSSIKFPHRWASSSNSKRKKKWIKKPSAEPSSQSQLHKNLHVDCLWLTLFCIAFETCFRGSIW